MAINADKAPKAQRGAVLCPEPHRKWQSSDSNAFSLGLSMFSREAKHLFLRHALSPFSGQPLGHL